MEVTNALAARLIKALKADHFTVDRFEHAARVHEIARTNNNRTASGAYALAGVDPRTSMITTLAPLQAG